LALTVGSVADIAGAPLCDELISVQSFVKKLKKSCATKYFKLQEEIQHGRPVS
jgi:hypothetical protein